MNNGAQGNLTFLMPQTREFAVFDNTNVALKNRLFFNTVQDGDGGHPLETRFSSPINNNSSI